MAENNSRRWIYFHSTSSSPGAILAFGGLRVTLIAECEFKDVKLYEPLHAKKAWGLPWAVSVYLQFLLLAANACQHGPSLQAGSLCVGSMGTHFATGCSNFLGKPVRDTLRRTGAVVKSCCSVRSEVLEQLLGLCGNLIYNINATVANVILSLISHYLGRHEQA